MAELVFFFKLNYFYFLQLFARLITGKLFDKTGLYNDGRRDTYNKHVYATRDKIINFVLEIFMVQEWSPFRGQHRQYL